MFYLYIDGDLISCSETFSEVYDIIFKEIFSDRKYLDQNSSSLIKFIDELFSHHHCLFTINDKNDHSQIMSVEVYYG